MACISGKEEIKGIIERVSGMKDENEKIELLLTRNVNEQIKNVDWDKLNAAISNRLNKARQIKTSVVRFSSVFKIAAGITVAAALIFITVMIKSKRPAIDQLSDGRTALVEFIDSRGSASVALIEPSDGAQVEVNITGKDERLANCYVQIIDSSAGQKEDINRPSWFIICMLESANGKNELNRDALDIIYLF